MKSEEFVSTLVVTEDMVRYVESVTRKQVRCSRWFSYRAGRITASLMKSVVASNVSCPSVSLLKQICYPEQNQFQAASTRWGKDHENDAQEAYLTCQRPQHCNFSCTVSGLFFKQRRALHCSHSGCCCELWLLR